MKGGTFYLVNSKGKDEIPGLRKRQHLKYSIQHLAASPVHSLEATVTVEHQTFRMEALEQFLTQSPPPPHTYTHFPSYTQSVAFLVGSLAFPQSPIVSNYFELCSLAPFSKCQFPDTA